MEPIHFKVPIKNGESIRVEHWDLDHFYDPIHFHEECQLTYIIEGHGDLFVGSTVIKFQAGEAFLFGKNLPHVLRNGEQYYKNNPKFSARAISVFFKEDSFASLFEKIPEAKIVAKLLKYSVYGIRIIPEQAEKLFLELIHLSNLNAFEKVLSIQNILDKISRSNYLHFVSLTSTPMKSVSCNYTKINKVFEYITENYKKQISLSEAASLVYMTPSAFCRFFKFHTQKTFFSFLVEFRVGIACKLILNGKYNSKESCYESGFNNLSNFHRHFKNVTDMTPREFKWSIERTNFL
jgi:AraC-like DNA-binding protein